MRNANTNRVKKYKLLDYIDPSETVVSCSTNIQLQDLELEEGLKFFSFLGPQIIYYA